MGGILGELEREGGYAALWEGVVLERKEADTVDYQCEVEPQGRQLKD